MVSNSTDESSDDQFEINIDLLGILRRRYALIIFGLLFGGSMATLYYFQQIPIYESKLVILVGQRSSELTSTGKGSLDGSGSIQEGILSTHLELIGSPKILEAASNLSGFRKTVSEIRGHLTISKGGEGLAKSATVLRASYKDPNPETAAKMLASIYESYKEYIDLQSRSVGTEAAELIAKAQVKNEETLRKAEEDYRTFVENLPSLLSAGGASTEDLHRIRLNGIEKELATLRSLLGESKARYEVIKEFTAGRKPEEFSDKDVLSLLAETEVSRLLAFMKITSQDTNSRLSESNRAEYQKLLDLTSRQKILRATVGSAHPSVDAINSQIESIQAYIKNESAKRAEIDEDSKRQITPVEMIRNYFLVLKNDISAMEKRESELLELSESESKLAKENEVRFMLANTLRSNLDRAQSRYDEVFKRLQEINLTNDYSGFSTDLLASPLAPGAPIWPTQSKIGAIGLLAGGILGLGLAVLVEMTQKTFSRPEDVEQTVGASVLAHIPRFNLAKLKKKLRPNSKIVPTVTAFHAPQSTDAETFRVLRTSVLFLAKRGSASVFMVTSPSPSDGKSTTTANLAVSLAQAGKRVLLVDADLRRPTVYFTLGMSKGPGLADFIENEATFEDCCRLSEQPNLSVCTHGKTTSRPAELLEDEVFRTFLQSARAVYDIVLIDTPPLLAVADPAVVANLVDGCFLTILVKKNNRTLVERATAILREHDCKILGVIVNSSEARRGGYGYSSYNYYGKGEYGYVKSYRKYYAAKDGVETTAVEQRKSSRNGHHARKEGDGVKTS